jgi:hypothetical protein
VPSGVAGRADGLDSATRSALATPIDAEGRPRIDDDAAVMVLV